METSVEPASSAVTADAATDWERKVDDILAAGEETDDDAKAGKLLDLLPSLPSSAQVETAKHIVNLTSDPHYSGIARYLTNAATPVEVLDELFSDLLNRPNSVKLPRMLDIARNPQHPEASEARNVLELYLDEDYGEDWWKWEQKLTEWLKDNPD
ncbi:MAG TPA: hypothetical protein PKA41_02445 [Verrucomicrobiota bacterium]|nr:hypothetical protein [Verrucomicrobiota bacterium]